MFARKKSPERIKLEEALLSAHADLAGLDIKDDKEAHAQAMKNVAELENLLNNYRSEKINPNTIITTTGSVLSVLVIVGYERGAVFSSAARNFVRQIK